MNMILASWLITAGSLIGAIFNARKSIIGYYIWLPANVAWIIYSAIINQYAQCALFAAYTVITAYGIWKWKHPVRTQEIIIKMDNGKEVKKVLPVAKG